ncbi:hypothetical protein C8J57DRAFT_1725801 [Mycena rebaudengoi]|nr:hypothetical protein C8J57DRAFT_1725801 [Mycena rebaudengoi]
MSLPPSSPCSLRACGLARPALDRKRDQRVPAAREHGVFEGASFAICTCLSHPSAAASSSCPSAFSFPCRPSDSFPHRPHPFFLPIVVSACSIFTTHTLRLHTCHTLLSLPFPPPPLLRAFLRPSLPSPFFPPNQPPPQARLAAESHGIVSESQKTRIFLRETRATLKRHWMLSVLQLPLARLARSLYPTDRYTPSPQGAIAGGAFTGWLPQFWGRCITIVVLLALRPSSPPLDPTHELQRVRRRRLPHTVRHEMSSPSISLRWRRPRAAQRALQLVNVHPALVSHPRLADMSPHPSASAQIEATGGDHLQVPGRVDGKPGMVPDYTKVQGILIGVVAAFVVFVMVVGPEYEPRLGSHFEKHRAGFGEGGGADDTYIDDEGVHHAAGRAEREAEKASEERSSTEKPVA